MIFSWLATIAVVGRNGSLKSSTVVRKGWIAAFKNTARWPGSPSLGASHPSPTKSTTIGDCKSGREAGPVRCVRVDAYRLAHTPHLTTHIRAMNFHQLSAATTVLLCENMTTGLKAKSPEAHTAVARQTRFK